VVAPIEPNVVNSGPSGNPSNLYNPELAAVFQRESGAYGCVILKIIIIFTIKLMVKSHRQNSVLKIQKEISSIQNFNSILVCNIHLFKKNPLTLLGFAPCILN